MSGEVLTIASLNTRGIPLTGSQLAARYAAIGAGFEAGDADVVCCQEVFTYWHLRLLARQMRSFRQVSYRRVPGYVPGRVPPGGRDDALHRFHPDRGRGHGGRRRARVRREGAARLRLGPHRTARPAVPAARRVGASRPGILGPTYIVMRVGEGVMSYVVDFTTVSTTGLESSPVAEAVDWVHGILEEERDIVIASRPLEATAFEIPAELAARFKFARQRSKLAGTIRGSFFTIKNEH